jgi:hypothetical protein
VPAEESPRAALRNQTLPTLPAEGSVFQIKVS